MMRVIQSLLVGTTIALSSVNLALAQAQPTLPPAEPNAQEVPVPLPAAPQSVPNTPADRTQVPQSQTTPPGQNCTFETGFTDVSPDHWAYEAVTRLSSRTIARCQPAS